MGITVVDKRSIHSIQYDYFITVLGFESRSLHIAKELSGTIDKGLFVRLTDRGGEVYKENSRLLELWGFEEFSIKNIKDAIYKDEEIIRIGIDISSMPRSVCAQIIYFLKVQVSYNLEVEILYAPAKYTNPDVDFGPVVSSGPVIPEYAGWSVFPDHSPQAVIGLGYETDRAMGVLDYLDVDTACAVVFLPDGHDQRFKREVETSNKQLLSELDSKKINVYELEDTVGTYVTLVSVVRGRELNGRVVLIPLGPKIFNAISLVVASVLNSDVTVWRVSGEDFVSNSDRVANGKIINFSLNSLNNLLR